jgi:hypothetical protein
MNGLCSLRAASIANFRAAALQGVTLSTLLPRCLSPNGKEEFVSLYTAESFRIEDGDSIARRSNQPSVPDLWVTEGRRSRSINNLVSPHPQRPALVSPSLALPIRATHSFREGLIHAVSYYSWGSKLCCCCLRDKSHLGFNRTDLEWCWLPQAP